MAPAGIECAVYRRQFSVMGITQLKLALEFASCDATKAGSLLRSE
jgi:hypothetical protein